MRWRNMDIPTPVSTRHRRSAVAAEKALYCQAQEAPKPLTVW
jgi:hypothetical protein